jgi:membrane-associated HD superfamily phosphohydrolase
LFLSFRLLLNDGDEMRCERIVAGVFVLCLSCFFSAYADMADGWMIRGVIIIIMTMTTERRSKNENKKQSLVVVLLLVVVSIIIMKCHDRVTCFMLNRILLILLV